MSVKIVRSFFEAYFWYSQGYPGMYFKVDIFDIITSVYEH